MGTDDAVSPRVLLVDATDTLEARLEAGLAAAGMEPVPVPSVAECVQTLEAEPVGGVVSRQELPASDGLQLLRSVRISRPDLPFVLWPSAGSEALAGEAVAAGASGYVASTDDAATVVSRLEEALERPAGPPDSEVGHRYRNLVEMSPAPINIFDADGVSIWCNEALLELFGLDSRAAFVGTPILDVIHPEDRDLARREIERVTQDVESTGPTDMRLQPPEGPVRYVRVSTAVGRVLGEDVGQAIAVDLTTRVERERQLSVLDQWLRHTVRNEVTIVQGLAESIEDGTAGDPANAARRIREHAGELVAQTNHQRDLIDVLSPASGPSPAAVPLDAVAARVVADGRETFPEADITFDRSDGVEVRALPEIRAALAELVRNAVQHADAEDPSVDLAVERAEGCGVVRVADDGPGIPASEREYLLLDREIDQLNHNSGLGLVLVYWTVRLSDGEIAFRENEPRGSVVEVRLPLAR